MLEDGISLAVLAGGYGLRCYGNRGVEEDEADGRMGGGFCEAPLEESASWSPSPPQAGAGIMHQELDLCQTRRLIRVPAAHQRRRSSTSADSVCCWRFWRLQTVFDGSLMTWNGEGGFFSFYFSGAHSEIVFKNLKK